MELDRRQTNIKNDALDISKKFEQLPASRDFSIRLARISRNIAARRDATTALFNHKYKAIKADIARGIDRDRAWFLQGVGTEVYRQVVRDSQINLRSNLQEITNYKNELCSVQ